MSRGRLRNWFHRDGGHCYICDRPVRLGKRFAPNTDDGASLDHVTPYSRGGSDSDDNVRLCCRGCNNDKGHQTIEEYLHRRKGAGR